MIKKRLVQQLFSLLLLIGFGIATSLEVKAQNGDISTLRVVGEANIAEGEIIADRTDNRDVNGTLTAGLRINSDLTGFTFESNNGILKIQQLPGASLLYLSPNERVVEIYRQGFVPFQLVLNSHNVTLESGKVWEIQITGDRKLENAPVRINVNPEDAIVFIDGEGTQLSGTFMETQLAEGQHVVQIQKNRYRILEDTINVSLSAVNNFTYQLEETPIIFLRLDSEPSGAAVYLDDNPGSNGRTPLQVQVYPGSHTIRLEMDGYVTQTDELQINNNTNALSYNLQEYAGYLTVNTTPANAGIIIDGAVQAQRENIKLTPGLHQLEVIASGFDAVKKNFEITLGDTLVETMNLGMITGNLIVSIMQIDANIVLKHNGQIVEQWLGSKRITDLPVGNYTVEATLQNFRTETQSFELTRDEDETLNINLVQIDGVGAYSISGIFEDAEVQITGRRFSQTYEKLPIEIESLPFGSYEVEVSKPGFETYTTDINFNSFSGSMVLVDEFSPKTKGKAFFRSLFIPGTGHGYLGKGGRGFLYFLGSAAAIGYTVKSYLDYEKSYNAFSENRQRYLSATSNFDMYKVAYTESYNTAQTAKEGITLGLTIFAVIKGLETFDLLLQPSNRKKLNNAKLEFNPTNTGISMTVKF